MKTPRTDSIVTGNSDPTRDEYEDLAQFARTLEKELITIELAKKEGEKGLKTFSLGLDPRKFNQIRTHLGVEVSHDIRCDVNGDHLNQNRWNSRALCYLLSYIYDLEQAPIATVLNNTEIVKNLKTVMAEMERESDSSVSRIHRSMIQNVLNEIEILRR